MAQDCAPHNIQIRDKFWGSGAGLNSQAFDEMLLSLCHGFTDEIASKHWRYSPGLGSSGSLLARKPNRPHIAAVQHETSQRGSGDVAAGTIPPLLRKVPACHTAKTGGLGIVGRMAARHLTVSWCSGGGFSG
jgi:hypothetical protein